MNAHEAVIRTFDGDAHIPERLQGGKTVLPLQEALHFGCPLSQGTEHDGTVRHGFVARNPDVTFHGAARLHLESHLFIAVVSHVRLS